MLKGNFWVEQVKEMDNKIASSYYLPTPNTLGLQDLSNQTHNVGCFQVSWELK